MSRLRMKRTPLTCERGDPPRGLARSVGFCCCYSSCSLRSILSILLIFFESEVLCAAVSCHRCIVFVHRHMVCYFIPKQFRFPPPRLCSSFPSPTYHIISFPPTHYVFRSIVSCVTYQVFGVPAVCLFWLVGSLPVCCVFLLYVLCSSILLV